MRAFGGFEKGTDYYLHQPLFHLKMTLFVLILLLEIAPMVTLIKWRRARARGAAIDTGRAQLFARISHIEAMLVLLMVVAATGMAAGGDLWLDERQGALVRGSPTRLTFRA